MLVKITLLCSSLMFPRSTTYFNYQIRFKLALLMMVTQENAEALLVATKEIGLEVNSDKTKYMVMSRDRNAGRGTV